MNSDMRSRAIVAAGTAVAAAWIGLLTLSAARAGSPGLGVVVAAASVAAILAAGRYCLPDDLRRTARLGLAAVVLPFLPSLAIAVAAKVTTAAAAKLIVLAAAAALLISVTAPAATVSTPGGFLARLADQTGSVRLSGSLGARAPPAAPGKPLRPARTVQILRKAMQSDLLFYFQ